MSAKPFVLKALEMEAAERYSAMPAHERKSCAEWCVGGSIAVQLGRARRFA